MFPPFDENAACLVLSALVELLNEGKVRLIRQARLSDERKISSLMLGAMLCREKNDASKIVNLITVSGISFKLEGFLPGVFVENIVSAKEIQTALEKNDKKIHELTNEINLIEARIKNKSENDKEILKDLKKNLAELKDIRSKLCDESLLKVFERYEFYCADGKKRKLLDIINDSFSLGEKIKLPPTGTGDCCEPKLLNYAFKNNLIPLSMAQTKINFKIKDECVRDCKGGEAVGVLTPMERKRNPEKPDGADNAPNALNKLKLENPCDLRCGLILPKILGLEIVYRDDEIIVINKESGLLSVPGRTEDKKDCVTNRVRALFPDCIEQPAVHRLDMETSGLMVLAFTKEAHRNLNRQFELKQVEKKYIALLDGVLAKKGFAESGQMELFFRLDVENRPHQIWDSVNGKSAVTRWQVLGVERYTCPDGTRKNVTRICFVPLTGRTHQLRLLSADSHGFALAIIGDSLYGNCKKGERLMLHSSELNFIHPKTNERMHFVSKAPF
ncbi:RluA family pseudouridine synthase [Treponema pectinovorum]|uniref:RluA family pseudouridine synthase n=1 Tax=Treponema pectinovorum TaxID=164 RepID=UPI0021C3BC2E|nr:RluA family pseudouridine synthase [Treponema pectinovorum]